MLELTVLGHNEGHVAHDLAVHLHRQVLIDVVAACVDFVNERLNLRVDLLDRTEVVFDILADRGVGFADFKPSDRLPSLVN